MAYTPRAMHSDGHGHQGIGTHGRLHTAAGKARPTELSLKLCRPTGTSRRAVRISEHVRPAEAVLKDREIRFVDVIVGV